MTPTPDVTPAPVPPVKKSVAPPPAWRQKAIALRDDLMSRVVDVSEVINRLNGILED